MISARRRCGLLLCLASYLLTLCFIIRVPVRDAVMHHGNRGPESYRGYMLPLRSKGKEPLKEGLVSLRETSFRARGPLSPYDAWLISHIRKNFLVPPHPEPYNLEEDKLDQKFLYYKYGFPSWKFILSVLMDLYRDRPLGFFVEAGALDGEYLSNTLYLEKKLGWEGLLVEPDALNFRALVRKKRKAWASNTCLATKPFPHEVILNSFTNRKRDDTWGRRGASRISKKINDANEGPGYLEYQVAQCLPFASLLLALNVTNVEVVILDVENVESDVLLNFPFDRITVDVWIVEHSVDFRLAEPPPQDNVVDGKFIFEDPFFVQFFEDKGYYYFDMYCSSIPDYVFVRRESPVFRTLRVPEGKWRRREICRGKPFVGPNLSNLTVTTHLELRDRRHFPYLSYSENPDG